MQVEVIKYSELQEQIFLKVFKLLLVVVIAGFLAGCFSARKALIQVSDQTLNEVESKQVWETLKQRRQEVSTIKVLQKINLVAGRRKDNLRQAVVLKRDGDFHLELLPPQGVLVLGAVVSRSGQGIGVDYAQKKVIRGDLTPQFMREALGVELPATDLYMLLTGRLVERLADEKHHANLSALRLNQSGDGIVFEDKEFHELLQIDRKSGLIQKLERRGDGFGSSGLEVEFDEYRNFNEGYNSGGIKATATSKKASEISLPSRVKVSYPAMDVTVTITSISMKVNEQIDFKPLEAIVPSGFEVEEIR